MQYLLLAVLLAAPSPPGQKPTEKAASEKVVVLRSRPVTYLPGAILVLPPPERYPASLDLSLAWDRTSKTDPFGRRGSEQFTQNAPAIGFMLDRQMVSLEIDGAFPGFRPRQSDVSASARLLLIHPGPASLGLELNYWALAFDRKAADAGDISLSTRRLTQAGTVGIAMRYRLPRRALMTCSVAFGGLFSQYDSVISSDGRIAAEPIVSEHPPILTVTLSVRSQPTRRLDMSGSLRYGRLLHTGSAWTPRDEWSGRATVAFRLIGSRKNALYLGTLARIAPRDAALCADSSLQLYLSFSKR